VSLGSTPQGGPPATAYDGTGQESPSRPIARRTNTQFSVEFRGVGRSFARAGQPATKSRGSRADGPSETHQVIRDITLTVSPGEVVGILGTSGCGKSTLLRIAAGLDDPTLGAVRIDGTPMAGIDARCAFAFQEPRLLPWRTLAANVAIGLPTGTSSEDGAQRVARLLELVGLTAFAGHRPREVSGGMAQRTSLARALARDPGVLLLDEPFASLDALTRMRMQDLLLDVHAAAPTTVLLVTHDVDEALQLSDRVILLGTEPGREGATIRQFVRVPG
jgi:sulfonate transport system ATP-binding protein